jgi:hypothetical protein
MDAVFGLFLVHALCIEHESFQNVVVPRDNAGKLGDEYEVIERSKRCTDLIFSSWLVE